MKLRTQRLSPTGSAALSSIIEETAIRFGVTAADVRSSRKTSIICDARRAIGYIAHGLGFSYPQIGRATRKHHTAYVHSSKKIRNIGKHAHEFEI